jgi:hypothetical protein
MLLNGVSRGRKVVFKLLTVGRVTKYNFIRQNAGGSVGIPGS